MLPQPRSSGPLFRVLDAGVEDANERLGQRFLDEVDFAERERAFLESAVEELIPLPRPKENGWLTPKRGPPVLSLSQSAIESPTHRCHSGLGRRR